MERHVGLRRDGPGARAFAGRRRKPLRAKSDKRIQQRPHEVAVTETCARRDGGCVARSMPGHVCSGPDTPHHLEKASAGGAWTEANIVTLCASLNGWVEDHPYAARFLGLVVRWDIDQAEAARRRKVAGMVVA